MEGGVGDAAQLLDPVGEGADVAPVEVVGRDVEVVVAQCLSGKFMSKRSIVLSSAARAL